MSVGSGKDKKNLVSVAYVVDKIGLSKQTVYSMIRGGLFPRPIRPGKWVKTEVNAWVKGKEDALNEDIRKRML